MNEAQQIHEESNTPRLKALRPLRFRDPLLDAPVKIASLVIHV
jgi:hypothetical protein